ncbi:MAG: four-carbon acid sugar kinase family protein, partial [Spirochaetaceae bacterium]
DPLIFKKVDSTLRGNISEEIAALASVFPERSFLVAPAFPSQGRTTQDGICLVHGIPLDQTDFARDPLNPAQNAYIPAILRHDALDPSVVDPRSLHQWAISASLHNETKARANTPRNTSVAVADAATEADLELIASVWREHSRTVIPVGSAGLASHLFAGPTSERANVTLPGPLLLVNGSLNPVALRQTEQAIESGFVDIVLNELPSEAEIATKIVAQLEDGKNVCLRTILNRSELTDWKDAFIRWCSAQELQVEYPLHEMLPMVFGQVINSVVRKVMPGGLVVFGGDTVLGIMNSMGVSALYPVTELFPGIVVSTVDAATVSPPLVTKAGGFGGADLVDRIRNSTRSRST